MKIPRRFTLIFLPLLMIGFLLLITQDTSSNEGIHRDLDLTPNICNDKAISIEIIESSTSDTEEVTELDSYPPYDKLEYTIKITNTGKLAENINIEYCIVILDEGSINHTFYKTLNKTLVIDQLEAQEIYEVPLEEARWALVSDVMILRVSVDGKSITTGTEPSHISWN